MVVYHSSGQVQVNGFLNHPGHPEKNRLIRFFTYTTWGHRVIVVSIMLSGAGSVAVSARAVGAPVSHVNPR